MTAGQVVTSRPTETAAVAGGGIGAALTAALNLPAKWSVIVVAAVGVLPAGVTWLVANGGLFGAIRSLFKGKPPGPSFDGGAAPSEPGQM